MNEQVSVEPESRPHYDRWERMRTESVWTTELRAFAKKSDLVVVRFETVPDAPSWHRDAAFVELDFVQESNKDGERRMRVRFAGWIGTGYRDDLREVTGEYSWKEYSREPANLYRPTSGSWLLHLYPNQATHAYSCFMAIASKSRLTFRVRLDYHTNPCMAESGLHGDVLTLEASKGKTRQGFDLDNATHRHNSARFGF